MLSPKELGSKIQKERMRLGISQRKMQELYGIPQPTLKDWEVGKNYPKLESINLLCEIFGYDFNVFLNEPYQEDAPRTQQTADVQEVTGLSEEAIVTLKSVREENITFFDTLIIESEQLCSLERRLATIYKFQYLYFDNLTNPKLRKIYSDVTDKINVYGSMSTPYDIQLAKELFVSMVEAEDILEPYEEPEHIFDLFYEEQSIPLIEYQIQQEVKRIIDITIKRRRENSNVEREESY